MSKRLIGIVIGLCSWIAAIVAIYPESISDPEKFLDKISRRTGIPIMGVNAYPPKPLKEYRLKPPFGPSRYGGYTENTKGLKKFGLNVDGNKRFYYTYTPQSIETKSKVPAVIVLHGSNRTGVSLADKWRNTAKRHGLKIYAPDGSGKNWSYAPDKPFIGALINMIKQDPKIDPNHIYLFGHSAGAIMGKLFTADFSTDIAASALHAGFIVDPLEVRNIKVSERKTPVCFMTGTFDKLVSLAKSKEAAQVFADAGHDAAFIEIVGHNHWYYTLADWINEKAWACMIQMPKPV